MRDLWEADACLYGAWMIRVGPGKLYIAVDYDGPGWLYIGETEGAVLEVEALDNGPDVRPHLVAGQEEPPEEPTEHKSSVRAASRSLGDPGQKLFSSKPLTGGREPDTTCVMTFT
jgi:hypothetical protein